MGFQSKFKNRMANIVDPEDISTDAKTGFQSKTKNRMANSVDPDETAHYEPSHLDLHCLLRYVLVCRAERVESPYQEIYAYGHQLITSLVT